MTIRYRANGIVFKKVDRNESDKIFSVFTDDFGKLDIFAKAIRKAPSKLKSGIDVFFLSEIEFIQGKNKKTLTDAFAIEKFKNISGDLSRLKIAYQISEILDSFIKGEEKDELVFDLFAEVLRKIENNQIKNYQLAYQYFFWNFVSFQGYKLEVNNCSVCGSKLNPYRIYFSGKEGGIICKKCSSLDKKSKKINSDVVKILRLIFSKNWETLSKLKIQQSSQRLLDDILKNAFHTFCPEHC